MKHTKITCDYSIKKCILGVGAQSKAAFCLVKGNIMHLCEIGGDISDLENFNIYDKEINRLKRRLKLNPEIIVCDLHPEYISTKYAGSVFEQVQHHEAHISSCIIDNNVKGKVIGVAFDGTGFGSDGNIWGGEFFIGDLKGFKRIAHLRYVPMVSGEAAIKEPWRMALGYLYQVYGRALKNLKIDFISWLDKKKRDILLESIDKKINTALTSSMGRMFDAVSALIGVRRYVTFEAEAAIKLEEKIWQEGLGFQDTGCRGKYDFKYASKNGVIIIDWGNIIRQIIGDVGYKKSNFEISLKFHNAVCGMVRDVCDLLNKRHNISKVCLSGGVFQNQYLKSNIRTMLEKKGFKVYFNSRVPTHDGGIALGQAALVAKRFT